MVSEISEIFFEHFGQTAVYDAVRFTASETPSIAFADG